MLQNDCLTYWGQDKMAAISRRHFQMHFLEWKGMNFKEDFPQVQLMIFSNGSDNGLAPAWWQAIIWPSDG